MNIKSTIIVLNIFLIYCTLQSQTIQLVLSPNPSPYISDWQSRTETATLIISNPTVEDISVKIKTELFNGQGALIANTVDSKMPVLMVPPGVSQYNAEDVFPIYALKYQGSLERTTAQTGRIPDDNYRFCVSLIDPQTGSPVGPSGAVCRVFNILAYQAPTLITPQNEEVIPERDIHGIVFRWTPVTPPPKTIATYRLQIFEVLEGQENMMALVNNQPIVEKDLRGVLQTQWPVEFALPESGKTYVWTITPLDDEERKIVDGHGFAEPFVFTIGYTLRTQEEEVGSVQVGETITAGENGEFSVIVTEVTTAATGELTGKGTAHINWLGVAVAVEFTNIKIDNAKQLTHGVITVRQGGSNSSSISAYPQAWGMAFLSTPWVAGVADGVVNWTNNQINNIVDGVINNTMGFSQPTIHYNSNIATPAIPDNSLKMPFGLQFPINGNNQKLILTEMVFKPDESKINFLAQSEFSKSGQNYKLGFVGKYFKIHPGNIEFANGRVELAEDFTIPSPKMDFILKKGTSTAGCYIEWSDNGIDQMGLGMDVSFSRDWLIPIPSNNLTDKVKATLSGNGTSMQDILLTGNLPNCEIVGTNGLKIEASNLALDLSDIRSIPTITFPANYPGSTDVTWRGFYMKTFGLTMPESWKTGSNTSPPSLAATDLIIDDLGITTKIKALNILDLQSGSVADLSASLDTIEVAILHSSLQSGSVKGKLVLPISEVTAQNTLKYKATFSQASSGGTFQIVIVPYQSIEASIMRGSMILKPTSNITATLAPGSITAAIKLNGVFKWDNPDLKPNAGTPPTNTGSSAPIRSGGIKGVKMELAFENVGLNYSNISGSNTNTLTFNYGNWSFASPQKRLANFPVTISKIYYKSLATGSSLELLRGAIMIDIVANLTEEIGGSTTVGAAFAVEFDKTNIKFTPKFKGVFIEKISVHADLSAVKINGSLTMYDSHLIYGDGFEAELDVTFTAVSLNVKALAQFGNTTYGTSPLEYYRYWRVEADAILPVGIPFLTGVGFYGFGGGAFYNMTPDSITSIKNPGNTVYTFKPKKSALGFMVKATIGTMPKFETFNADVSLLAVFNQSTGGLAKISFLGNFWLAAKLTERPASKIKGSVIVSYDFTDKLFFMAASLSIKVPPVITTEHNGIDSPVGFVMSINGRTNKWYFKCGYPDDTNDVWIFGTKLYSYFMFGNDIPFPTGFTKEFIAGYTSAMGSPPGGSFSNGVSTGGVGDDTKRGKGIATGIGIKVGPITKSTYVGTGCCLCKRSWSVGGNILAGAELNLAIMYQDGCEGINGYRAFGNIGFYASASLGYTGTPTRGNCSTETGTLLTVYGSGWLSGQFPNPTYIAGYVDGTVSVPVIGGFHFSRSFEYGSQCTGIAEVITNDAVEDEADSLKNKLIQYVTPTGRYNFPVSSTINVKYGLMPDVVFDIAENQGDGTIKNRTFKLVVTKSLEIQNPDGTWSAQTLQTKVSNTGDHQYYLKFNPFNLSSQLSTLPAINISPIINTTSGNTLMTSNGNINVVSISGSIPPPPAPNYPNPTPNPVNQLIPNMEYRFIVSASLMELLPNGNTVTWVPALTRLNQPVSETKSYQFRTGPRPLANAVTATSRI